MALDLTRYRGPSVSSRRSSNNLGISQIPSQSLTQYGSGEIKSEINTYLSRIGGLNLGTYDFSTQAVGYTPVSALAVNAEEAVDRARRYNMSIMGEAGAMAQQMTDIDIQNKERQLDEFVPGWRQSTDKVRAINESYMRGEIPKDVADNLTRSAAYVTAMGGGSAQGQAALTARDLGLTSMQLQQQGIAGTTSYMQMMQSLMPEMTTVNQIMSTQGMNAQMAVTTALQNTANKLQADIATSAGTLDAAKFTQDLKLRGAQAAATTGLAQAGLQADAYARAMDVGTSNIVNDYYARLNQSNIDITNRLRGVNLMLAQNKPTGFNLQ